MSEKYDSVVIGAGAGGLAMALLLAASGRKTLVVEKSPSPGGALGSFTHKGYNLDAGFHFAGALQNGGIFDRILHSFGIREMITPQFLDSDTANRFHFTSSGRIIDFPYGIENLKKSLKGQFPGENNAINTYFRDIERIVRHTPTLHFATLHLTPEPLKEDTITFSSYLDSITDNNLLKQTLNALVMCHGSAPSEISLAANARLCYGFYESVSTIKGGGKALVDAFLTALRKHNVELKCSEEAIKITDIKNKRAGKLLLKSGGEIEAENFILTVSPQIIADILPKEHFPPAFFKRVGSYQCTPGFFTVFAFLDEGTKTIDSSSITSMYPVDDIDCLSLPGWQGPGALAVMHSKSGNTDIITAFEPLYWKTVSAWEGSATGKRPADYYKWKKAKTEEILSRITECFPSYREKINHITSATPLTYRDYLNHYHGAAYGIKQKPGQFNLMGPFRIRNIFAAGQSAVLPGVLGTIMASVLVARHIIGTDEFTRTLKL